MDVSCSLHLTECPLCKREHAGSAPFNKVVERGIEWRYHICRGCGLVYQSPQMTDAEMARYYADDYWAIHGQEEELDDWQATLQQARAEHLLSLVPSDGRVSHLLDVGCAGGCILREAKKRFGGTVVGVEPNDQFRKLAIEQGFEVHASIEELIQSGGTLTGKMPAPREIAGETPTPRKFDCVTLSHVLEHFRDPAAVLRQLREELLTENGHLVLEVPNLYSHKSFEPSHPVCFTETTLQAALAAAGFAPRHVILHSHPRTDVEVPLNISVVAQPAAVPSEPAYSPPNVWLERVKRAYLSKRGAWWRRAWKGLRVGVASLFTSDLEY